MHDDSAMVAQSRRRVLVVDDDLTFAKFVCDLLERMNLQPEVSVTGSDALTRVSRGGWSGMFLDLRLPDIDGLNVLLRVRQGGDDLPVVVLTGAGNVPAAVEAMRLGALDFIEKPISRVALASAVARLLALESGAPRTPDGPTRDSPLPALSDRVLRLADVVVGFIDSPRDVHTIQALCRGSGVYIASRTFRAWCRAERVRARALLDLARVLRAHRAASNGGCRIVDCLDADERTTRALFLRGFFVPRLPESCGSLADLCRFQNYVTNPRILEAITRRLRHSRG